MKSLSQLRWLIMLGLLAPIFIACSSSAENNAGDRHEADTASQDTGATIPAVLTNHLLTGTHQARVPVRMIAGVPENEVEALEVTIRPESISEDEQYVIYVVEAGTDEYLGSFSYYLPAQVGELKKFVVGVPTALKTGKAAGSDVEIIVRLEPINPQALLTETRLTVLSAESIR